MKSNGNKNKENNTKNINDYNIEQLPKMISLKQRHTSNMPYKIEQEEQSSCSSSSKVPSRFQPSRSPNNRSSLFGLPATPYLGPSLSPVSSPQWRMAAGSSSPGATAGRAVPKSALIMSRILTSRVGGISNMELMQSVSGTKDIIEKTSLDCHGVEEQSNYDKVIDFPYHRSPTSSPLGSLIMKTEVCTELNNELEIKTTECIFNFEDIFEDEEMERKGKENEFEECKETNLLNKKPMMIENNKVFPSENPFSEVMNEKEIEEENIQSGSGLAKYETKFERKANNKQRENKSRRRSGKKDRMVERRKLIEEKSKADKEDNDVKEEFLNNENKVTNNNLPILKGDGSCSQKEQKKYDESEKEIVGNFVLTAQDLIAQVERIMFTSLSEKCSLQIISLSNNKEEVKTKKESDKLKQSFSEKGIQHQKLLNKEKELEENSLEVKDSIIGGPTDEKKEKGRKGKSSKRKGKRYNCVSRKPLPLLQSFDQQNTPEEKDMEENMLTSPCSTTSSPSFPCSSSSALIRGDEQNSSRPNSSIGRMIGRWRHTTGGIQLRNITLASVWERLATGIRSEGRDAFRASSAVQLTNTTRYNMDEVLPLIHYRPLYQNLIRSIHFSPASHSFISLLQCLPINIENLAKPLMKIFIHSNQMRQFFRLICFEYLSNSSDVNTLFRSQSLASKVMYEMMKCVGHKYLVCTLMPLIDLIFTERKSCEIDPSKLRVGESLDQNFHNITVYAELAFSRVVDSSQRCPPALRELFAELRDVVEQFFPGREDVGRLALSSFLILRFFAAAILNPKLFGLKMATPDVNISRTLVLVSKILQRIANCVVSANPPSTKEQWLSPLLQQFSDELHNKAMIDFLDEISMSFTETEESGDNTAGRAMVDNSNVDSFTSPTNTDTLGVDIVKELHIVYSQIADHLDALCSMGWCCRYACSCSTTIVQ